MSTVNNPFPYFPDAGTNGYIYIGSANQDAQTNPIVAYRDAELTAPWSQPIRTLNGYPAYQGAKAGIFLGVSEFSITVKDSNGVIVLNDNAAQRFLNYDDLTSATSIIVTARDEAEAAATAAALSDAAAETAQAEAESARDAANSAAVAAQQYYPGARSYVPRGLTSVAITAAGSGGTNGTYTCPLTGDNLSVDAYATVVVTGGTVTSASVAAPGLYIGASPTAGLVDVSSITGLTGATLTPTIGYLKTSGQTWLTDTDPASAYLSLFQNQANSAVEIDAQFDPMSAGAAAASAAAAAETVNSAYSIQRELGRGPAQGVNLLDMSGRGTANQSINADGSINTSSSGNTLSDAIRVTPSATYIVNKALNGVRQLDSAGAYISGTYQASIAAGGTISTASGAAFVQVSMATSTISRSMLLAGTALPAIYLAPAFLDPASAQRMQIETAIGVTRSLLGRNSSIIDPNAATVGSALGLTGQPYSLSGWSVTDFIPARSTDQFITNFSSGTNGASWYAEDGATFLSTFTITSGTAFGPPPAGARYWRAQVNADASTGTTRAWRSATTPTGSPGYPLVDPAAQQRNEITNARAVLDAAQPNPRQLFNKDDALAIADTAIANNGATYGASGYGVTGFFEVTAGLPHISNYSSSSGQVVYYDENRAIINSGTNYSITAGTPFVPPAGAFYARRSIASWATRKEDMYIYRGAYSTGQINLTGQPSAGNTVTINGVSIEFVASGATGAQVNIGASSSATASNLLTYINANSATLLVSATITTPTSLVRLTSTGIGPANNSITLTRVGANISLSGATMTGGLPLSLAYKPFGGSNNAAAAGKGIAVFGNSQVDFNYFQARLAALTGATIVANKGNPGLSYGQLADTELASDFPNLAALNGANIVWVVEGPNEWAQAGRALGTVEDSASTNTVGGKLRKILDGFLALNVALIVGFTGNPYRGNFRYDSGGGVFVNITPDTGANAQGYTGAELDDFVRAFCKRWSCPFADLRGELGISELTDVNNSSNTGLKTHTSDGLHWTAATGLRVGAIMAAKTNAVLS